MINKLANEIIKYIKKNRKMPKLITINQIGYNRNQQAYRLAYAITHNGKEVPRGFHIDNPKNPKGNRWEGTKVYKNDYIKLAKKYTQYVEKNKRTPNYATIHGKKVTLTLLIVEFARIIAYYNKNNRLPNYCTFDSAHTRATTTQKEKQASIKKHGHATAHGCDNMGQNNDYYCGVHSLQEVFRNLTGIVVSQDTIAGWAGTTIYGTGHNGIDTAIEMFNKKYSKNLKGRWYNFSDLGFGGLDKIVKSNNQDFIVHSLYRNTYGHYEVVNKVKDTTLLIQNSLGDYCENGCHCGYVEERTHREFQSYINGISQKSILVIQNDG